jgi:hypothetical protein
LLVVFCCLEGRGWGGGFGLILRILECCGVWKVGWSNEGV